ncbi:hypothetical protein GCM10022381_29980 [Leifsonia kafniensis]|uniref:Uncharacterized protein n=1 Tax=Leifsonia kafniensis TaxID=475957 RepID=A0ABP7KSE7_9MICO
MRAIATLEPGEGALQTIDKIDPRCDPVCCEDELQLGVRHEVCQLATGAAHIQRDDHGAHKRGAEEGSHVLGRVRREHTDMVSALNAEPEEPARYAHRLLEELFVREILRRKCDRRYRGPALGSAYQKISERHGFTSYDPVHVISSSRTFGASPESKAYQPQSTLTLTISQE